MWILCAGILAVHSLAMMFDEFHFHRRRGLSAWERIGHPLDTLSVLACFFVAFYLPYSHRNLAVFLGLAAFSLLLITKDEAVHAKACGPGEMWLHSLLFVLHPLVLGIAYLYWVATAAWPATEVGRAAYRIFSPADHFAVLVREMRAEGLGSFQVFFAMQAVLAVGFFLFQVLYWNFQWKKMEALKDAKTLWDFARPQPHARGAQVLQG